MPYHTSRMDFLFEPTESTNENNQDELNWSLLPLVLPAHLIVQQLDLWAKLFSVKDIILMNDTVLVDNCSV